MADVTATALKTSETPDLQHTELNQTAQSVVREPAYLDPEGGYADADAGRAAELTAMTKQAPLSVNNLPSKFYLEQTITPTVLKALSEVAKARPDKPLEFVAYYLLKHNPARPVQNEGAPIGHRHPDDKGETAEQQS